MWVLVGLSIGGLAIALDRAIYLFRTSDNFRRLQAASCSRFLRVGNVEAARERLAPSRSVEAQVAAAGLSAPEDGAASAEERIAGRDADRPSSAWSGGSRFSARWAPTRPSSACSAPSSGSSAPSPS